MNTQTSSRNSTHNSSKSIKAACKSAIIPIPEIPDSPWETVIKPPSSSKLLTQYLDNLVEDYRITKSKPHKVEYIYREEVKE